MGFFDRFFLLLWSLSLAILSLTTVWLILFPGLWGFQDMNSVWQMISGSSSKWTMLAVSLLFFVLAIRFLWLSIRRQRIALGVDRETEFGHFHISLLTIEQLALKASEKVKGIYDITARVRLVPEEQAVGIGLKIVVDGERSLPELSEDLQSKVKEKVEQIAGIDVTDVSVYISQTSKKERSRVRVN